MVDFTSAVTAGNNPMVIVKMKQTEKARTEIWRKREGIHPGPYVFIVAFH